MTSRDNRPEDSFDVNVLEGLRERVGRDGGLDEDLLPARSTRKSLLFGALIGLAAAGGAAWYILGYGGGEPASGPQEIPVVKGEKAPVKVRPTDPGGMDVPNQDKLVYNRLDKGEQKPEVEHLMPQPATPKELPKAPSDNLGDGMSPLPAPPPAPGVTTDAAKPVAVPKVTPLASAEPPKPAAAPTAKVATATPSPAPAAPAKPAPAATTPAASGGAWQIQLGALKEEAKATSEWNRAVKAAPTILGSLSHEVVRADLGSKGVYYRLRAGSYASREQAEGVCDSLKAKGLGCVVAKR